MTRETRVEGGVPEWRGQPGAVIEAVFFVTAGNGDEIPGPAKFHQGPLGANSGIAAKGDYAPMLNSSVVACRVITDVMSKLKGAGAAEGREPGTTLARFTAERLDSGWTLVYEHDDVDELLEVGAFDTLE